MGIPLGFPTSAAQDLLSVFSFQRRVGLRASVSQPVTTYAAIIAGSVFSCAILMSKWPRLRLTKYVDDLPISDRGMNHTVATVVTEAVSSMVGWLENGLDCHVSKDEEGVEGKSVVLVSNGSLKAALSSSTKALGIRVVSHGRIRNRGSEATQNAIRTADQNQEEDAQQVCGLPFALSSPAACTSGQRWCERFRLQVSAWSNNWLGLPLTWVLWGQGSVRS